MDVDSIGLGRDFRAVLQERLATCDVMLALIGRDWVDGKDKSGRRRLDVPGDYVRMEIAAALKRNIPVTPLLLHGAQMPSAEQLPEDLSDLAYRNGFELSHNRWESDVQELIKRLGLAARNDTPSGATQPPKKPWFAIAGASVVAIAVAVGGFLYYEKTTRENVKGETEAPSAGANTEASKPIADANSAKSPIVAGKGKLLGEASKADGPSQSLAKNLLDASPKEKHNAGVSAKRGGQEQTHTFNSADFQLKIDTPGSYTSSPFRVDNLDFGKDFLINFQIKSTRNGGSTRYGIAWNYRPSDFLLFTLHSTNGGYYSIGPGRSRTYAPFSRLSEGFISINGENNFDILQMKMNGSTLNFAINGKEVWSTTSYRLNSNQFAFWVADFSEALIKSYTVRQ